MRKKISDYTKYHNIRCASLAFVLVGSLILFVGGCGQNDGADQVAEQESSAPAQDCNVTVDTKPWHTFKTLAGRMAAGQVVPDEELENYTRMPTVNAWRLSLAPHVPAPLNLVNWLKGAWADELGQPKKRKSTADRFSINRSYRYSYQNRDGIDALLANYESGAAGCQIRALANNWLSPENIPDPLVLNFLPAKSEIRIFEDEILVDTGVLQAGGLAQSNRHIVALLFRNREALVGPNPIEVGGEEAVANTMRVMMTEGVASWIEKTLELEFDASHPDLGKVHIIPTDLFRKAQDTVALMEELLPPMMADPAVLQRDGREFARSMAASNAFNTMSLAMASVIGNRLGSERLRAVRRSVPDFVAAYQEAALLNASPAPAPGAIGVELYESVRPLAPELYTALSDLLNRHYADQ